MNQIQILSEEVRNKIAAGEVIDHPASIVRELIDNSIDSDATWISVRLFEDSLEEFSVEITDDGCGIYPEDLLNAFLMHATSKIRSFEDIYELQTMGFRGEALASIASISQIQIISSTENTGNGFSIFCVGGKTGETKGTPAKRGTQVIVSKIFFNTPARKKFFVGKYLNKDLFWQEFVRKALSFENIGFAFESISKGKVKKNIQIPQSATLLERISLLFSGKFDQNLLEVNVTEQRESGKSILRGYLSDLQIKNRTRKDQYFYVRGRYVQNVSLYKAMQSAYMTFLPQKFFSACFLKIECSPQMLDVNVHPTKKDVRFEDTGGIYSLVYQGVKKTLSTHIQVRLFPSEVVDVETKETGLPENFIYTKSENSSFEGSKTEEFSEKSTENKDRFLNQIFKGFSTTTMGPRGRKGVEIPLLERKIHDLQKFSIDTGEKNRPIRIVGQYKNTYILFEKEGNFLMADQHGLHERMLFEDYQERFKAGVEKQTLLIPLVISFEEAGRDLLLKNSKFLENLGFEIEIFGEGLCKVESVPFVLGYTWSENSVKELLELVLENMGQSVEEVTRKISASLSCWNSVKSGEDLPDWKSLELVYSFYKKGYVATCPHGRPIIKEWSEMKIKKYFYRNYPS